MKTEILKAIGKIEIDHSEFDHEFDWSNRSYATCIKKIESENYNIELELEEEVKWTDTDYYERVNILVIGLLITDENSQEIECDIKDFELKRALNY